MPPIQSYEIYTGNKYNGQISDASTPRVIGSVVAAQDTGFGIAMALDGTIDANGGSLFGLSVRELNHEATNKPSDGATHYPAGQTVSVLREGYINLEVTVGTAVAGDAVRFAADGTVDMTAGTASTNVFWMGAGSVGDVVRSRIDIIAP